MSIIRVEGLQKTYNGTHILKNVDLELNKGEVFTLIGPTGSGKTTLIKLLDLLEKPSGGTIYFNGADVTREEKRRLEARRSMALVQQKPIIFSMNVYDNVACGLKWRHIDRKTIAGKVTHALSMVGMSDYVSRDARTLSGGETQRIALARALVVEPELLLLDEPTANLDPNSAAKIEEVIEHIINEYDMGIIMTTHNLLQGQRLADRVGVLIDGEMMQIGTPEEIFSMPASKRVAEFVGIDNILEGSIEEKDGELASIRIASGIISAITPLEKDTSVYVMIRPEDIILSLTMEHSSARNMFTGAITRITTVGSLVRVEVDTGFPLFVILTSRSALDLGLEVGKQVCASFKATALTVLQRWK